MLKSEVKNVLLDLFLKNADGSVITTKFIIDADNRNPISTADSKKGY